MTLGSGTMTGAGIFVLPGVAANIAGPVVDPGDADVGRDFLREWADGHGFLSRIVRGSLAFDAIEALDTPVLLTERPSARSLWTRG